MNTFSEVELYKIGDILTIKSDANTTRSGKGNRGKVVTVLGVHVAGGLDIAYYMVDVPDCSGIWHHELERGVFSEQDYEYL